MTQDMPPFVSWIGHGGAEMPAPATFTGVNAYLFTVQGDRAAMQATVDKLLDHGAGKIRHRVMASTFLVSFMDMARCTSPVPPAVGWLPGRECAVWIPLLQEGAGLLPRLTMWAPYIFIDYTIGMVTGRETWGWPKVLGDIEMPPDGAGAPAAFTCRTTVFRTLSADTEGEKRAPLLRVSGTRPMVKPGIDYGSGGEAVKAILSRMFGDAVAAVYDFFPWRPQIPTVVLKQIRDARRQDCACYRALVDSPVQVSAFRGMGLLEDRFELSLLTCESHGVLRDFTGRTPEGPETRLPVGHAFWAGLDFAALPGEVLE